MSLVFWKSRGCGKSYIFLSLDAGRTYIYSFGPFWQQDFFFFVNDDVILYSESLKIFIFLNLKNFMI